MQSTIDNTRNNKKTEEKTTRVYMPQNISSKLHEDEICIRFTTFCDASAFPG